MSWESIGSISTGEMPNDEAWILFGLRLAKKYVELVCGEAPAGSKLGIMWHEYELGSYPSLGVWCDFDEPWTYINACENTLAIFDDAVSWHVLKQHFEEQALAEVEGDEDEEIGDED